MLTDLGRWLHNEKANCTTVTVTKALVLRILLEDQGRITKSISILVPVDSMNCAQTAQLKTICYH